MEPKENTKEEKKKSATAIGSECRGKGWRNSGLVRYSLCNEGQARIY